MMVTTRSNGIKSKLEKEENEKMKKDENMKESEKKKKDEKMEGEMRKKTKGKKKDLDTNTKSHSYDVPDKSTLGLEVRIGSKTTRGRSDITGEAKSVKRQAANTSLHKKIEESGKVAQLGKTKSKWPPVWMFIFAFILIASVCALVMKEGDTSFLSKEDFKAKICDLEMLFPAQTLYFWKLIGSASLDFIVSKNPKRPAVILLAGGPDAHPTLDALASKLSTSYSHLERNWSVTEIDGMQYGNTDPHATKKNIDDKLKNGFNNGNQVAIIHHLESIPAEASMIFHSYCENDNAPFKRVVIIFTVHMTEELNPKDDIKINQKKVEKHLENQWKDAVDKDHIEAMFSRVATAAAFVTPE